MVPMHAKKRKGAFQEPHRSAGETPIGVKLRADFFAGLIFFFPVKTSLDGDGLHPESLHRCRRTQLAAAINLRPSPMGPLSALGPYRPKVELAQWRRTTQGYGRSDAPA